MMENSFMEELSTYLEAHYQNPDLAISDICNNLFVSRSKLHRLIKGQTNMTTTEFINKFRLHKSLPLLQEDIAINKIAQMNGFKDPNYFAKLFKKYNGVSPSNYALGKASVSRFFNPHYSIGLRKEG